MYEYVIPQEFDQSDRIGNYTIPQAMILGFGIILIALILASGFVSFWIGVPLSLVVLIATFYVMKKTINGIPLYEFVLIFVVYRSSPKLIIYKMDNLKENMRFDEEDEKMAHEIFFEEEQEVVEGSKKGKKNAKNQKGSTNKKATDKRNQEKNTRKTVKKRK